MSNLIDGQFSIDISKIKNINKQQISTLSHGKGLTSELTETFFRKAAGFKNKTTALELYALHNLDYLISLDTSNSVKEHFQNDPKHS
jgi:hypothetical protein